MEAIGVLSRMDQTALDQLEVERLKNLALGRASAVKELLTQIVDREHAIERLLVEVERLQRQVLRNRRQKRKLINVIRGHQKV